ncbi:MAG: hypothetical protein AMXMBFR82_13710 [Candidatus Hydrogenedentota bacterium]
MPDPQTVPTALRIVATIHLVVGVLAAIKFFVLLSQNTFSIQFGILGIPIYFGLLHYRNGWRICSLVLLWFGMIGLPIIGLIALVSHAPAYFELFGIKVAQIPRILVVFWVIPFFALAVWQYRVLTRADIRVLFEQPGTVTSSHPL